VDGFKAFLDVTVADDDQVVSIVIDWGDGTTETVSSPQPLTHTSHIYPAVGAYEIKLVVTDNDGAQADLAVPVTTTLPTSGLILHTPFDDSLTSSVGSAFSNGGLVEVYGAGRNGGSAFDMRGQNDSSTNALLHQPALNMSQSFSLALWVKPQIGVNSESRIVGQGQWFNLFTNSGGYISWGVLDSNGYSDASTRISFVNPAKIPTSTWTFYVGVVEQQGANTALRLYQNGALVADALHENKAYATPGSCKFYVGLQPNDNYCTGTQPREFQAFPGYVDDLRVYNRALTDGEIQALFNE
jgi:hypothetical protein